MNRSQRRAFLARMTALGCGVFAGSRRAWGQAAPPMVTDPVVDLMKPRTNEAIERGLRYLAGRQNEDGAFGLNDYRRNVAVIALSGMAFMAHGSTPGRGPFGRNVSRAVDYVVKHVQESGFIIATGFTSHGPMYGHGFATLFLAEAYGMTTDTSVREQLEKAVKLIINSQNRDGGWRYQPQTTEADISVTICQLMALRAARNAGIYVPNETIELSVDYVKRSQNADGGFMYMLQGGPSEFARSAAGVVALYSAGIYEGPEIEKGLDYLSQHLPTTDAVDRSQHYMYGHYYAVQAMWHAGGEFWRRWYPAIHDALLARQNKEEGYWQDLICPEYGTAMACMILQMPNNYLPIFQR
ncbi:MAG: prenyltransferase/squalene oxidase repeat-containing protein [Pirellulaceae bacterium]